MSLDDSIPLENQSWICNCPASLSKCKVMGDLKHLPVVGRCPDCGRTYAEWAAECDAKESA
jgi:hypothetical protein